jgi:predicted transcriptional regulator
MKASSEINLRRKIYKLIEKNPGLNLVKIAEILKISWQLADYHLLYLNKEEIITIVREEGYKRYYVKGEISVESRKKLALLRQEIPLKIVMLILEKKSMTHRKILEFFDIAASTLSYHLKKLVKYGLLFYEEIDNERKYMIKNEKELKNILIKYKPYSWAGDFTGMWANLSWK